MFVLDNVLLIGNRIIPCDVDMVPISAKINHVPSMIHLCARNDNTRNTAQIHIHLEPFGICLTDTGSVYNKRIRIMNRQRCIILAVERKSVVNTEYFFIITLAI